MKSPLMVPLTVMVGNRPSTSTRSSSVRNGNPAAAASAGGLASAAAPSMPSAASGCWPCPAGGAGSADATGSGQLIPPCR